MLSPPPAAWPASWLVARQAVRQRRRLPRVRAGKTIGGSWLDLRGPFGERVGDDGAPLGVRRQVALADRDVAEHDAGGPEVFVRDALDVRGRHRLGLCVADAEGIARIIAEGLIFSELE